MKSVKGGFIRCWRCVMTEVPKPRHNDWPFSRGRVLLEGGTQHHGSPHLLYALKPPYQCFQRCPSTLIVPWRYTYATVMNASENILIGYSACKPLELIDAHGSIPPVAQRRNGITSAAFKPTKTSTAAI